MPIATKSLIAEAFIELLSKKNIDKITVKDISETCGISRQSFYYHFQDVPELIEWAFEQSIQKAVSKSLEEDDPVKAIEYFVSMSNESSEIVEKLLKSRMHERFRKMLIDGISTYLLEIMSYKDPAVALSRKDIESTLVFCSSGMAGLLITKAGDESIDTYELAAWIYHMVSAIAEKNKEECF